MNQDTVGKWRKHFAELRRQGPRRGRPLHLSPPDRAIVLCVVGKSQIQALISDRKIKRGFHRSVSSLRADIFADIIAQNADPKPLRRTKSADDILASIERFCRRNTTTDRIQ